MKPIFARETLDKLTFLLGDETVLRGMTELPARVPFSDAAISFLSTVSGILMHDPEAKKYPDVVTLGFWLRSASLRNLKERAEKRDGGMRMGRGITFHIAPSNVPVNFAYSLAAGLLLGNACVVRLPAKAFEQTRLIISAIDAALKTHPAWRPYLCLVRYGRDRAVNDLLSALSDVRIVWGGDQTGMELRKSPLPPRAGEITFANRFSFAVIDADRYLAAERKDLIAQGFYNDTFLTDQNACTSPRLVIWTGAKKREAKAVFWELLHEQVLKKYAFQPIMGVNKLTDACLCAAALPGARVEPHTDHLIVRVRVPRLTPALIDLSGSCGYFFEYDCDAIEDLYPLCNDNRCQTVAFLGQREALAALLSRGVRGIDRVVPIGHTLDFDLLWDGYDLTERLTRTIAI